MSEIIKCTLDNDIDFFAIPKNLEVGTKVKVELILFDKDDRELGKKVPENIKVETNPDKEMYGNFNEVIRYEFKIRTLAEELNIKVEDIAYVNGWMDIDGDDVKTLYDKEIRFELIKCFCNRDFTVDEVKNIVKTIRDNTYYDGNPISQYHGSKLFYVYAQVPQSQRTYEKFTEVLNKSFNKYEITKCSHKIHYLANMYVETMYFTATREGKGINDFRYDPYRGRGFQHLTWKENYQSYKNETGIDIVKNYELVSDDLDIAADVGAWYWKKLNVNKYAEQDSIFDTARSINLPSATRSNQINGYENREKAWGALKKNFNYPNSCKNK